jgi:hypothetical protein
MTGVTRPKVGGWQRTRFRKTCFYVLDGSYVTVYSYPPGELEGRLRNL